MSAAEIGGGDGPDLFTLSRSSDPITSKEAAADVAPRITECQQAVLEFARSHPRGFTDRTLVEMLAGRFGPSTLRTRRSELRDAGLIKELRDTDGQQVFTTHETSARRHTVWIIAE